MVLSPPLFETASCRTPFRADAGSRSVKQLLQNCDGVDQIGIAVEACREHERRHPATRIRARGLRDSTIAVVPRRRNSKKIEYKQGYPTGAHVLLPRPRVARIHGCSVRYAYDPALLDETCGRRWKNLRLLRINEQRKGLRKDLDHFDRQLLGVIRYVLS